MIRRILLASLFVAGFAQIATAADGPAEARYQALLAKAKTGKQQVDWQALRFAYADQPSVNVVDDGLNEIRKKMLQARVNHDFADLLTQANLILDKDWVDGQAHLMASIALGEQGLPEESKREQAIGVALLKSIQTGDGRSPKTAFTVISVREEYELMAARQRHSTRQSLVSDSGHMYDVLDTVGQGGDTMSFYFLIDRVMAAEKKVFAPSKP